MNKIMKIMNKIINIMLIACALIGCEERIFDGNDKIESYYIKNSLSTKISYKLIGITSERALQLGYTVESEINPSTTTEVYKALIGVGGYEIDSIKVFDNNNNLIFKGDIEQIVNNSTIEIISDYSSKITLDINNDIFNTN
jgi:hypothetical protein